MSHITKSLEAEERYHKKHLLLRNRGAIQDLGKLFQGPGAECLADVGPKLVRPRPERLQPQNLPTFAGCRPERLALDVG